MPIYNNSIFPGNTEDNYILSPKGLGYMNQKANIRRNCNSQTLTNDGTSDTSSSVKEKK